MAKKDTPRSMLQAFIENVPTTAPVKRTRPRSRSPDEKKINETIPSQSRKRRRRSSLAVKQTPRTMIESYMYDHKTQTPFVRASRRRSETVTPFSQFGVNPTDTVTPRTALEGFLDGAPEETPFQKTFQPEENSEIDNESDVQQLPNETIHVTHSPIADENAENVVLSQKERRSNQHHITLRQFSKGMADLTRPANVTGEEMFSSDDEDIPDIPPDTTINVLVDSLNSEDDQEPIKLLQKDKRKKQHHITLTQFSQGLKNAEAMKKKDGGSESGGMADDESDEEQLGLSEIRRGQRMSRLSAHSVAQRSDLSIEVQSFVSPTKSKLHITDELDLTPSQRTSVLKKISLDQVRDVSDLTPSQRSKISNKSATLNITNESDLTLARRSVLGKMSAEGQVTDDLTPSKRLMISNRLEGVLDTEIGDLTPSRRHGTPNRLQNISPGQSNLTPSEKLTTKRSMQLETSHGSDLTPSRRKSVLNLQESDLTPSNRTRTQSRLGNISAQEFASNINTPSKTLRGKTAYQTELGLSSSTLTRSTKQQISEQSDFSPYQQRTSVRHTLQESNLTSSKTVYESETHENSNESGLAESRVDRSLALEDQTNLSLSQRTKRSDESQGSTLKSQRNFLESSKKNFQKLQNTTAENVIDAEPNENIQIQNSVVHSATKGKVSASGLPTPVRTPFTSNMTILENIKPLSSSTPARVLKDKISVSRIGTPNRILVKSTSGTPTPRRVTIQSGTPKRTPSRVLISNSSMVNMSNNASFSNSVSARNTSKGDAVFKKSTDEGRSLQTGLGRKTSVNNQGSENMDQHDTENDEDEGEIDEDTAEIYKLKTPHLQQNISRIPTPIYSSTPAPTRTVQQPRPPPAQQISRKRQDIGTRVTSTMLPNNIIKQAFQHFSNMKVSPDTMNELVKFTDTYLENTFKSLEAFALHAGRKTIDESDVELMMKRQGFITEKQPLNVLVENILPLELRQEILPIARANNVVVPL